MSDSVRRLPVYLVLDCSGSMFGPSIEAVRQGVKYLLGDLRGDPQALETVWLSVITFDSSARQVVPLTELGQFQEPQLDPGGSTNLAQALKILMASIDTEVRKMTADQKGDWKPLVFLMTDGVPDSGCGWETVADELKKRRPGNIIACACGPDAKTDVLKRLTEVVVEMRNYTPDTFKAFFKWVSASVTTASQKIGGNNDPALGDLPPPPAAIQMV